MVAMAFEAKKRFGVSILNYCLTSNHIHLILKDDQGGDAIPQTMQLVAGRMGQEYNRRKNRKGAFWQDRYHATAVEADVHLIQCMVYVDLNMVRAGIVSHPSEWPFCGYKDIYAPRKRYSLIDHEIMKESLGIRGREEFETTYQSWTAVALERGTLMGREGRWTESIAVGSEGFVRGVKEKLGAKAMWREVVGANGSYELREAAGGYEAIWGGQNDGLRLKNTFFWDI